ncbi:hypothetical protein PAESOLCIP111_04587 [Paenibacillus solanacearum]|uniref:Acyltransferase 3 domain-containing protein n=1 Tax=Paenibacillus solanacearum TaxID=2048548 RepID=A0A916NR08_9BACL|nr:acyltransferase [Paenibacillus solanacearum]CAG7643951.1 hypothetical protein PAESOLCIP111_04587 [Paenibacillus solanacearum]
MKPKLQMVPIQAARGIAVMLVMLFHASQMGQKYFEYNFLGVSSLGKSGAYTFFFALTGYLMYMLYRDRFGQQAEAAPFLVKRLLRVYPLYWLIMIAVVPIYFMYPAFGLGYEREPSVIIRSMLLWPQAHAPILGVAWSLSYVICFYLVFSLLFVLREKLAVAVFSSWLSMIVLHALGWIQVKDTLFLQFLFSEIHLEFFSGVLVAYLVRRNHIRGNSLIWLLAGAAMYPALWQLKLRFPNFPYIDLLYTAGSALILTGVVQWKAAGSRFMKPLAACGDASYSILLASLPSLSISLKLASAAHMQRLIGAPATVALCYIVALLLCLLVYRWIERPLQAWLKRTLVPASQHKLSYGKRKAATP